MSQDKEHEAFETQTFFDTEDNDPDVHRNPDGTYVSYYVQLAWQGWQARAALASQQAAQWNPPPLTCPRSNRSDCALFGASIRVNSAKGSDHG